MYTHALCAPITSDASKQRISIIYDLSMTLGIPYGNSIILFLIKNLFLVLNLLKYHNDLPGFKIKSAESLIENLSQEDPSNDNNNSLG